MIQHKQPSEIAREALKLLAARKLAPTPMNYQLCYNEIADIPNVPGFPEAYLRRIALALTAQNHPQKKQLDQLDVAISRHSWQGIEEALVAFTKAGATAPTNGKADSLPSAEGLASNAVRECFQKLAHMIESILPALVNGDEGFSEQVVDLLQLLRDPAVDIPSVRSELEIFNQRLSFAAEEQAEIKQALLKLLHLIIENISKLILEDSWLEGQIGALLDAVSPPLSLRRLDDVERRIRDVMFKQAMAKERSIEAQAEMRQMLETFIERLVEMNESSTTFQVKIEENARRIEKAKTIEDLAPLLHEVIDATRAMAEDTAQARDQLQTLQVKVLATEAEIAKLHLELNNASAMARHDPLTNTLNRKGLDEALAREIASMRRKETSLSVSLLDIDNFKKLNDQLGHETGDAALLHLVKVVRACMRPSDSLARYGGEEFVILMPDTPLDEAVKAMTRLQRELTKNFFLAGNERILITFSAGVTQFSPEETGAEAIKRADEAMYLAKRSGKNRVLSG
jgi:diguanylate cyclase